MTTQVNGRERSPDAPVEVTGLAALRIGALFARDPIAGMRAGYAAFGPFAVLHKALPGSGRIKAPLLGLPLVLTAGPVFNSETLGNPTVWRTVSILPGGPRRSAARRLREGIISMAGRRHAHYRAMVVPPMRKASIEALGDDMARIVAQEVDTWPTGETVDLWDYGRRLLRALAIGLLFGGDKASGYAVADAVSRVLAAKWDPRVIGMPINMPGTPFGRMVRDSEALERQVLAWADDKRGPVDPRDLASITINSSDENGGPAAERTLAGHLVSLIAGATETCQNTLVWTLILLALHPGVAADLMDELESALGAGPPSLPRVASLPLLDSVIKESMRIIPPVPLQFRVAERDTELAGHPVPRGARVVLSAFLTNRLPDVYPDSDRFDPARWARLTPSPFEYSNFSAGPRSCPGYWFGTSVVKLSLAAIMLRFRVSLAPDARIDYTVQPGMRPRGQVPIVLHPQDRAFASASVRGQIRDLVRLPR
jgi:cytochrome P450